MPLTEEGIIEVEGMMSRWVRLSTGAKAHYVTSGESGPAVVLLHGGIIGSSGTAGWRFMAPFLGANGFRVYCPDMPAFGLTEDPEDAYAHGEGGHADFVHDFANAVCIDQFHISGNSMGCSNAVNYVTAHPERILSYALIAGGVGDIVDGTDDGRRSPPAGGAPEHPAVRRHARLDAHDDGSDHLPAAARSATTSSRCAPRQRTAPRCLHEADADDDGRERPRWDPNVNRAARMSTKGRFDKMTIPGIYLYGRQDVLSPVENGYLQEDVLPEHPVLLPGRDCGHQGQTDQPDMFNQVFLEFFRDGKVSWETAQTAGISDRRPPNPDLVAVPVGVTA